jgi:hypothetical protein
MLMRLAESWISLHFPLSSVQMTNCRYTGRNKDKNHSDDGYQGYSKNSSRYGLDGLDAVAPLDVAMAFDTHGLRRPRSAEIRLYFRTSRYSQQPIVMTP